MHRTLFTFHEIASHENTMIRNIPRIPFGILKERNFMFDTVIDCSPSELLPLKKLCDYRMNDTCSSMLIIFIRNLVDEFSFLFSFGSINLSVFVMIYLPLCNFPFVLVNQFRLKWRNLSWICSPSIVKSPPKKRVASIAKFLTNECF